MKQFFREVWESLKGSPGRLWYFLTHGELHPDCLPPPYTATFTASDPFWRTEGSRSTLKLDDGTFMVYDKGEADKARVTEWDENHYFLGTRRQLPWVIYVAPTEFPFKLDSAS